jgi:hypothetical protein
MPASAGVTGEFFCKILLENFSINIEGKIMQGCGFKTATALHNFLFI